MVINENEILIKWGKNNIVYVRNSIYIYYFEFFIKYFV